MGTNRLNIISNKICLALLGISMAVGIALDCRAGVVDPVDPSAYPAADRKEWGQLRWVLKLAEQPLADFTNFESVNEIGDSAKRYEIAFSAYFLGSEQFSKFPAWRGPVQNAYDRLIQKMITKPVWEYWSKDSRGRPVFEPGLDSPETPAIDPVAYRNIMYSGHLGMMIGQYEMLFNDHKWDKPGSIVFTWNGNTKFVYDNRSLQEAMFLQFINNPVPGIECEPNAIFPPCNQHPILGWKHYDYLHGTRYFDAAAPLFAKWFKKDFINPKTHEIGNTYFVKQRIVLSQWNPRLGNAMDSKLEAAVKSGKLSLNSPANDGWTGTFMHAWDPKTVRQLYPYMKKHCVIDKAGGGKTVRMDTLSKPDFFGFFTALAAEMGDEATKTELLKRADEIFSPVWQDGTYHYAFHDDIGEAFSAPKVKKVVPTGGLTEHDCCKRKIEESSNLQDRLFALARALPAGGLWKMYNEPFDKDHFTEPAITDVDVKNVILKRAVYDRKKTTLIVSTIGSGNAGRASFRIINLDPAKNYIINDNGSALEEIKGAKEHTVNFDNSGDHDFIMITFPQKQGV